MSQRQGDKGETPRETEDPGGPRAPTRDGSSSAGPTPTEAELVADGWQRCFEADEPRLSEAAEIYRELGFEVRLLPVAVRDEGCSECVQSHSDRLRVIFTRRLPEVDETGS